ncbi:MAG TPA: nucleotidyltransferase domain-containing protein [Methanospirillum sp.]|nr:nucleotidyltransferase domain-containing protein [Methanospirillum sp.]
MRADSSATGLSETQISQIRSVIESCPRVQKAVLFGSRAMGSHRYGSDIDIALDGDEMTLEDLLQLHNLIDDLNLPFMLDLIQVQRIDNTDLIDHIRRVGKVLYTRDSV